MSHSHPTIALWPVPLWRSRPVPLSVCLSLCLSVCPRALVMLGATRAVLGEAVPMAVGYCSPDRFLQWVIYYILVPGEGIQTSQPFIIHKWKSGT